MVSLFVLITAAIMTGSDRSRASMGRRWKRDDAILATAGTQVLAVLVSKLNALSSPAAAATLRELRETREQGQPRALSEDRTLDDRRRSRHNVAVALHHAALTTAVTLLGMKWLDGLSSTIRVPSELAPDTSLLAARTRPSCRRQCHQHSKCRLPPSPSPASAQGEPFFGRHRHRLKMTMASVASPPRYCVTRRLA